MYLIELKNAGHLSIQPHCVACALAKLLARCRCQQRYREAHWLLQEVVRAFLSDFGIVMSLPDVVYGIHSGKNVTKLVRAPYLKLDVFGAVHVPPVPGL